MKRVFILNKNSGNYSDEVVKKIREAQSFHKIPDKDLEVIPAQSIEDTMKQAYKSCLNTDNVVLFSVGGDGTLHRVVNGIGDKKPIISVLPTGTGNDFSKLLYGDRNFDDVLKMSISYEDYAFIDVINVNGHKAINSVSIGLDAKIAKEKTGKNYTLSVIKNILKPELNETTIRYDDKELTDQFMLLSIMNGKYFGGGYNVCPNAVIDDGLIDLCYVKRIGLLKSISTLLKLRNGKHVNLNHVNNDIVKRLVIKSDKPTCYALDGEIYEDKVLDISVEPKSVKILTRNDF